MREWPWTFGVALTACSGNTAPPPNSVPVEPTVSAEPETAPEPIDVGVKPAVVSSPPEAREVPQSAAVVPTKKQALKASRAVLDKGKLAQLAPIVPVPDGRAAVVWRNFTDVSEASVDLVVLVQTDGVWVAQSQTTVTRASTPWLGDDPPPFAVTARSDDYDDDGEPEVLVRVRTPQMCPGGGPNTITQMRIYDLAPTLEPVLATELRHLMDAYPEEATEATVTYADANGDGHGDVKIVYVSKSEGTAKTATNLWTYAPDRDAWILRKPEYERWGCEW